MKSRLSRAVAGLAVLIAMLIAAPLLAGMSSANYQIPNDVISGGGSAMSSASYQLVGTIGQSSPLGTASSTAYTNYPGFWQADECVYDPDSDTLSNASEYGIGTDPYDADSDDDSLNDGEEICLCIDGYTTDPLSDDTDSDNLPDGAELTNGTIPNGPNAFDTDRDGLGDGEEVYAGADTFETNPLKWDTDLDGLPDKFESDNSIGHLDNLNPTLAADGAVSYDPDLNTNAHEYWNGTSLWASNPTGQAACGFWGDGDGDGFISPSDKASLSSVIKGIGYSYANVIPPTGETQELDTDGFFSPSDLSLVSVMIKTLDTTTINSRPVSLEPVSTCLPSMAVGDTCHVTVSVVNAAAKKQPGIGVIFSVDPTSTGTATIFGGEGEDTGNRYDTSDTIIPGPEGAYTSVMVRPDTAGTVKINARIPQCGETMNVGRSCPQFDLPNFATITVTP